MRGCRFGVGAADGLVRIIVVDTFSHTETYFAIVFSHVGKPMDVIQFSRA